MQAPLQDSFICFFKLFCGKRGRQELRATIGRSREESQDVGGLSFAHGEAQRWTSERTCSDLLASGDALDYL